MNSSAQISNNLSQVTDKDEITIVITDSGLGGLSVMENIADRLATSGHYRKINLIFVNALFDEYSGYNSLTSKDEKINIFDDVLNAITKRYNPDVILIACNTLSVLYDQTPFSGKTETPVIGIVDCGVDMISEALASDPGSFVIIFGTETTIGEGSHKKALLEENIPGERIITKACPQLQSFIEQDPEGEETEMLITVYLTEALEEVAKPDATLYISLNCTHYGYSEDLWRKAFSETPFNLGGVLNPNTKLGASLFIDKNSNRYPETEISLLVVSKVELLNADSLIRLFGKSNQAMAEAIENYLLIPDLF